MLDIAHPVTYNIQAPRKIGLVKRAESRRENYSEIAPNERLNRLTKQNGFRIISKRPGLDKQFARGRRTRMHHIEVTN